ncbi:MAG TPA: hypothetical protein PL041_00585 [Melioribacteraceae bacterium]|nr:hypothetical protein [Melioribacteraceae bacterium]
MKRLFILAIILTVSVSFYGQDKKEIKEKIKSLKGDVKEIIIKTDKETVTFKGKDAEYVFKNIKKQKEKEMKFVITSGDDEDVIYLNGKQFEWVNIDSLIKLKEFDIKCINPDSLSKLKKFKFNFNIDDSSLVHKNVIIEMKDDDKKIIIIEKDKDGKEIEKIYEGEEAEKKLKEMEKEGKVKKHKKTIIIHEKDDIKNDKE